MKLLSAIQQKHLDQFTIQHEPISSVELMNRAGEVLFEYLLPKIGIHQEIHLFCGAGNNGGDGLVLHRLFKLTGFTVYTYLVPFAELSDTCQEQFDRVKGDVILWNDNTKPVFSADAIIIDALLGIGSSRVPEGILKTAIECINQSARYVYAIDLPSGLPADELPTYETIVKATETLCIHAPKLTFFLPETQGYVGKWANLTIGLNTDEYNSLPTRYSLLLQEEVKDLLPIRERFSHKGTYGHGLLIAGSDGKMGACLLSGEAALRAGLGLLSIHTVNQGKYSLNQRLPEAMAIWDSNEKELSGDCLPDLSGFSALGIGPGLGTGFGTSNALKACLLSRKPCVIDADALNVLAENPELLELLHQNCILTPHPKEFERIAGSFSSSLERLERGIHFAQTYSCQLVLKDAITAIITATGQVYFNVTGNSGMAKGGSGDVLTGIILGLITQGIAAPSAAKIAVFHHGSAGDLAKTLKGERALLASDLIHALHIE